jgi:hypothetical protein
MRTDWDRVADEMIVAAIVLALGILLAAGLYFLTT